VLGSEGKKLQTTLLKNPEDREILDLVDVECMLPEARTSECTAPLGYRCPYMRYRQSLPPARIAESGETYDVEILSESGLSQSPPLRFTTKRS
jgi:hypothetical protein